MSKITKIMHVEKMSLPKPHIIFSVSELISEYYVVYYLSGQMRVYGDFIGLPKGAKRFVEHSLKHTAETKDKSCLYKHTIFSMAVNSYVRNTPKGDNDK